LSYTNFVGVASRINQTNLYVSFENNSSNGILVETGGYKRQSFRVNVDHSITDRIKISASNSYIMTNNDMADSEYQAFRQALMMEPDADLLRDNENGQPYNFKPNHWNELSDNPLYDLHYRERASHKNRYMGNYEVNVAMFDWMSFKASYSIESQDYERRTYSPKGMYDGFSDGDYVLEVGQLGRVRDKTFNQNFRATLAFNKSWENVDFNGKISYLGEDYFRLINNLYGDNFELSDYPSFSVIDDSNKRFTEQIYETRAENYFAIASFVVKDRYIFDALIRQDISSRFGEDNRSNIYYRGSAAYRLTQDIEIPGVQEMKLRTAIGTAGIRPGYSYQYETYNRNKGVYTKSTLGNKDLKPSLSTEVEIGLDIAFLDRFTGEFTFSNTVTEDQFVQVDLLSHAGGFPSQWQNAATMESKTFEAMLNAKILDAKDWRWDLTFTFDNTRTTITELDVPERKVGPGKTFYLREGELYGTMYGNGFVKSLDQMQSQLADGDDISNYEVNSEGYVVRAGTQATVNEKPITILDSEGNKKYMKIGDINPDFRMGISSTLSYKGLSFYMLWRWKHGGDVYNKTSQNMVRDRRLGMMDQYGKNPEEMKTVGYYDGFYNGGAASKFWVEDGSYLKLGEASLRYSLKSNNLGALGKYINSVDFGLIGRNLLMFADYTGFDPEVTSSGYIYDDMGYPNFRSYSFSLGIKF
ncbi:MAG: TonB-dependent receptor, partial [Chlamydiia bacterium]|nr:TonB-dependent receptor [Chlamydiia bacterium]